LLKDRNKKTNKGIYPLATVKEKTNTTRA